MKSKTSCFNKTIFKKNMTHFWPVWVMILAWNLFILPFMIFNCYLNRGDSSAMTAQQILNSRTCEIGELVQVYMNPVILFIFSVIAVMAVFSWLYTARAAYTFHALPVTRKELFVTNYLSGLVFLLLPQLLGFLAGTLVSAACGYTCMELLFDGMLCALGLSFFFYSFHVFIAMFTGQLAAVPIFALILHLLEVGGRLLLDALMSCISYGISGDFHTTKLDVLSPLYYLSRHVKVAFSYEQEYRVCQGVLGIDVMLAYAAAGIVFAAAGFMIYRKRKLETAGSLISVPWIVPVFRWGVAFCTGVLFGLMFCSVFHNSFPAAVTAGVLFGIIGFFGAEMLLKKGFRVFHKKRFAECGVFLVFLLAVLFSMEWDLFGLERKIPDAQQVERAYLDSMYLIGGEDREQIETIIDVHRQIVDSKAEFEALEKKDPAWEHTGYVNIRYCMKDGSELVRGYRVPSREDQIRDPDTVMGKIAEAAMEPETYLQWIFGINYRDNSLRGGSITKYQDGVDVEKDLSREQINALYEAVCADVKAGNMRDMIIGRYWNDEKYLENTYENSINFEMYNKDGIVDLYNQYTDQRGYGYVDQRSSTCIVDFDKNCENIIRALIQTGVIESEKDLITLEEQNQTTGATNTTASW